MLFSTKTGPAMEPVSLQEALEHLRWEFDTEHDLIERLIKSATEYVENYTQRLIIQRTITGYADGFENCMELKPDLVSVASIKYQDTTDTQQTLDSSVYKVNPHKLVGELKLKSGQSWPSTFDDDLVVEVEFTAGMAESNEDAPHDIKAAILLMVGTLFENRESIVVGVSSSDMPLTVKMLLDPYRIPVIG